MTSFFTFGDNNMRTLFNFLQDALAKNNEFEIRFGKFYQDRSRSNDGRHHTNFDSNMETNSFYNLKRMFEKQNVPKLIKRTKEFIYQQKGQSGTAKRIVDLDDNSITTMMKQNLRKYDVYDYDLRMSVSSERKGINIPNENDYVLVRTKNRTSFRLPFGSLDLTVVVQEENTKERKTTTKYEVEMEITSMDQNMIITYLMIILQNRQDNFFVIPGNERRRVVSEYRTIVQNNYFVGAQPETLHKEKISKLYKSEYSVTDKADGERAFLVIDQNGSVYFMDNNLNKVFKTDIASCKLEDSNQEEDTSSTLSTLSSCNENSKKLYYSTVIDGELVKHDNKIYFLAFDILAYNKRDLRGNQEYDLRKRLNRLDHIVKTLSQSKYYVISVKHYYFGNVFSGSKKILDSVGEKFYENDGLIFTPIKEPYPLVKKWQNLLKWKPAELNTIDFYAKKVSSGVWQLYVQGETNQQVKHKTDTVLFDVNRLCGNDMQSNDITYETTFQDDLVDPTTGEFYKTDTVIEFRWDFTVKKFIPLRTRWDKTVNPKKHGNFSKVACDIWNNINNPIEKEYLLKFYSNVKSGRDDFFFERMRRFHNKIKEFLYNKYCKDINSLLELCSGRGGDMHKWIYNNIKTVTGYDISDKNIDECRRRLETTKINSDYNYDFYRLDLTRDDASDIIYNKNQQIFDNVCCQFGIHYFFKSEQSFNNMIDILDKSLKNNGRFVVTFMDNKCLDNLFGDKQIVSREVDNEIVYLLEKESIGVKSCFGNRLKITLNGNNILGEGSDEWIIDFSDFCKRMEVRGYRCIETELFSNLYTADSGIELQSCEVDISFLNRYCVFEKVRSNLCDIPVQKQKIFENLTTEFDFETIDLHQKNISVQRISSLYNIVDIINCIEYRYYKNDVKDVQLDNIPEIGFPIIEKLFSELKIQYQPIFVNDPLNFDQYLEVPSHIYFTYHKHVIEKRTDTENDQENVEYNNWYIIMNNNNLLFSKPSEKYETYIETQNNTEQIEVNGKPDHNIEIQNQSDSKYQLLQDYNKVKDSNVKITIKLLKEFLQRVDLKVSGKRDELQQRLETYLTVV
jgi:hypothetical protein